MGYDIAIDLGSLNTRIYIGELGIIINEPTVVSIDLDDDKIIACGKQAYAMLGRTSERINTVFPVVRGVITDFSITQQMLKCFFAKNGVKRLSSSRVLINAPAQLTDVEKFNLINLGLSLGMKKVCILDDCKAAAMGADVNVCDPVGRFVLDVGAGSSKIGVLSLGENSVSKTLKLAGNDLDDEIIKFIRKKYGIIIGKRMAESAKIAICTAREPSELEFFKIKGRDAVSGLPKAVEVSNFEFLAMVEEFAAKLCHLIQEAIDETPPELLADIYNQGIIMTGGTSNLKELARYISQRMKIRVIKPEDAHLCTVNGCKNGLKYINTATKDSLAGVNPIKVISGK